MLPTRPNASHCTIMNSSSEILACSLAAAALRNEPLYCLQTFAKTAIVGPTSCVRITPPSSGRSSSTRQCRNVHQPSKGLLGVTLFCCISIPYHRRVNVSTPKRPVTCKSAILVRVDNPHDVGLARVPDHPEMI